MTGTRILRLCLARLNYRVRHFAARSGRLPDAVIVGTMKGGTTSLHSYLCQHAQLHGGLKKEVHFFDENFHRGERWYRRHFTSRDGGMVIESTPIYMFHRDVVPLLHGMLPGIRVIVVLRDPVTRAYSHFQHSTRKRRIHPVSFEDAVRHDLEVFRRRGVFGCGSAADVYGSVVRRGIYAPQVGRLFEYFGDRVLVLRSEDLFTSPLAETNRVLEFLGLGRLSALSDVPQNTGAYRRPKAIPLEHELRDFFDPYNRELYGMLRVDGWWPAGFVDGERSAGLRADAA